ncbi:MAG TPA: hypothetical protein ENJ95_01240, partial [Bacteroidetes bacterium]|nr:hypothetical protein [Bacteroidota bacterium]
MQQQWFKFWAIGDGHPEHRWWHFIFRIIAALSVYMFLDYALRAVTNLPMESYFEPIIFIAFLKYFFTSKYVLFLLPLFFVVILHHNRFCAFALTSPQPQKGRTSPQCTKPKMVQYIFSKKNIACKWEVFNHGKSVRFLVVLATVILAWVFSTYDFNLYFNQGHYIDRLLLLGLVLLVYW